MRKLLPLVTAFLLLTGSLLAQKKITGKVMDEKDNPIPNVSVLVKGTKLGTTTKSDGTYALTVPDNAKTLIFSSTELETQEARISNSSLSITMKTQSKLLEEAVIVVAYGTVKKSEYTGSSAQINSKDFEKRPLTNITTALAGSAPGIQTTSASGQPGSSLGIRLRGFGSYSANSSPLFVLDGAPYDGNIAALNPDDIESVSTLKDASTTALYGSRGANGVILITTKRGKKNRNQVTFKATQGFSQRGIPEYDRVDAFQYYPLMWEAYKNNLVYTGNINAADAAKIASGAFPRYTTGTNAGKQNYNNVAYSDVSQLLGYNPFNVASTAIVNTDGTINPSAQLLWPEDLDWTGAATSGSGARKEYGLSYNGGTEKADYFGSFGYTNEKGYLINSGYKRFSGRVSVNTQPMSWFRTGFNLGGAYANVNNGYTDGGTSIVNPFSFTRYIAPIYPIYAHDPGTGAYSLNNLGERYYDYGNTGTASRPYSPGRHTIAENLWNERFVKRTTANARTFVDIIFTPWLKLTSNFAVDVNDYLFQEYDNKIVGDGAPSGRARRTNSKTTSYTFNQLLNFNKRFGDHNITALAGHENYNYNYNYLYGSKQGQVVDGISEFENFSTINSVSSYTDKSKIESYLSKIGYDYKGTYFLTGSLRRDGNSRFSSEARWDNFWSVGLAWRADKESFMRSITWIDQLKLRGSYGVTGNDAGIGYYPYQSLYNLGYNNATEAGYIIGTVGNDSLTWESGKSLDIGVDFALLKGRITGTVEYFNRVSSGLIFNVPQPLSFGGTPSGGFSITKNIGSMYNRGVEVQLGGDIIRSKNFTWNLLLNWTKFKSQISKMPDGRPEIINGTKKLSVGHSIYDFYLRHYYGVDPADGSALYTHIAYNAASARLIDNGKGGKDTLTTDINNAQLMYTGNSAVPNFYGSIGNTFTYKNFQLLVNLTYQVGGKIYDGSYASMMTAGNFGTTANVDMLKRWQKPGDITNVPRMDYGKTAIFDAASDRWLTDASYLNINNISLSYALPKSLLSKITAQNASVFVGVENAAIFTKRKGMSSGSSFAGTTDNTYNVSRILTAGVNITF